MDTQKAAFKRWQQNMNRWSQLKLVKPQKLSVHRAKSTSQEKIKKYFEELSTIMVANNLLDKPNQIFNLDETGITSDHAPPKIVCNKDAKAQAVTSPMSSTVIIIAAGNSIGNHIPPYFIRVSVGCLFFLREHHQEPQVR